ncbi:DJ-1/PfpI family protein [Paenibacillus sp. OAS669]|uniref:DJ-1/PfpI family protein n=1 Tax=Paenibacillus sp. OAS669 TaxID=2663821 RepID=UPI001A109896|nr:DJ-1/PfpI family protein [Paenibacillus sp. OAS669]MBE1444825.1 putative intracellular protease/amidase [Paenibacillus sp. OAS669]
MKHRRYCFLPGADNWKDPMNGPIIEKAKQLLNAGGNVAAICGATLALGDAGLLDDRQHTSNSLEYLNLFSPSYKGAARYKNEKIVTDGNLITTGSAGAIELAREVIALLGLFAEETLEAWYNYFTSGDPKYFYAMMETLQDSNS